LRDLGRDVVLGVVFAAATTGTRESRSAEPIAAESQRGHQEDLEKLAHNPRPFVTTCANAHHRAPSMFIRRWPRAQEFMTIC
jgi:hypothetical protein